MQKFLPLNIFVFFTKPFVLHIIAKSLDGIFRCLAIGDGVEYQCHEQSGHHVEDGVLFDEYGCQDDAAHQGEGTVFDQLVVAKVFASGQCNMRTSGIEHVDTREQVCRRIC